MVSSETRGTGKPLGYDIEFAVTNVNVAVPELADRAVQTVAVTSGATGGAGMSDVNNILGLGRRGRIRIKPLGHSTFVVSWDDGGVLEEADRVTGPWMEVVGAVSPYTVSGGINQKFYRSRR